MAFDDLARPLARYSTDHTFQFAHPGFPGIAANHLPQRFVADLQLCRRQPRFLLLPRNQVIACDGPLFQIRVSAHLHDLHAVQQRPRDTFQGVGGGDEHDLGEVVRQVQIVVAELPVLCRIEDLHQRGGRVAAEVAAQLVDLLQHDDGIGDLGAPHGLQNTSGHGADVGPAMPAQFRFVVQTAQAQTLEIAPHGASNGLSKGSLAHAGGADETQNGCF